MSTTAKITLASSIVFTVSMIAFVNYNHRAERIRMRQGVDRDIERQKRKEDNKRLLDDNIKASKELKVV
ncbi:hypothetical protein LOTGIDRAFT_216005 [Lottia gigantea]|uniref:PET117 cytochrome c oxidase chaperone n=1 Tax=Lottia gigantea TaxID=225164 RepID=V4AA25_LOTGI|nr:hypothetical protein LOTGIDRAFT_216005 [Lottia gigantea]ESO93617.1 hypothetical protein LOTGIDRAFT_216005 [Lottia gigantea]